jgi:hypothetical protein
MSTFKARLLIGALWAFLPLATSGCSLLQILQTRQNDVCSSWEGNDVSDLISSWGPPTSTYAEPNGNTLYEWDTANGVHVTPDEMWRTQAAQRRGLPTSTTAFTAGPDNKIVSWRWQGACRN